MAKPGKRGGKQICLWVRDPKQMQANANYVAQVAYEKYGVDLLHVHKRQRNEGIASVSASAEWALDFLVTLHKSGQLPD